MFVRTDLGGEIKFAGGKCLFGRKHCGKHWERERSGEGIRPVWGGTGAAGRHGPSVALGSGSVKSIAEREYGADVVARHVS